MRYHVLRPVRLGVIIALVVLCVGGAVAVYLFLFLGRITSAAKIDAPKTQSWIAAYPQKTSVQSAAPTADGGVVVILSTIKNTKTGEEARHVAKFDAAGRQVWERFYIFNATGVAGEPVIETKFIHEAADGYIVGLRVGPRSMGGSCEEGAPSLDFGLMKLASDGSVLWERYFDTHYGGCNGNFDSLTNVVPVDDGYLAMGASMKIEIGQSMWEAERPGWIIKVDSEGSMVWQRYFQVPHAITDTLEDPGSGGTRIDAIVQLSDGYGVTGATMNNHFGSPMTWVAKLASDGAIMWQRSFEDTGGVSIAGPIDDGGLVVAGTNWLARFDSEGSIVWKKEYQSIRGTPEMLFRTVVQQGDRFVVAGDGNPISKGYPHPILIEVNSAGEPQWQKVYVRGNSGTVMSFARTDGGYLLGANNPIGGNTSGFIVRADAKGAVTGKNKGKVRIAPFTVKARNGVLKPIDRGLEEAGGWTVTTSNLGINAIVTPSVTTAAFMPPLSYTPPPSAPPRLPAPQPSSQSIPPPPSQPSSWLRSLFSRPAPPPAPSTPSVSTEPAEEQEDIKTPDEFVTPLSDAEMQAYKAASQEKCINILIASEKRGFYYNGELLDVGGAPDIFANEARIAGDRLAYVMRREKDGRYYIVVDDEVVGPISLVQSPDRPRAWLRLNEKHYTYILETEYLRKEYRPVLHLIYDGKDMGEVIAPFGYKLNGDHVIYNKKTADNAFYHLYVDGKKVAEGSAGDFDGKYFGYVAVARGADDAKLILHGKKLGYGGDLTLKDGHRAYILGRTPNVIDPKVYYDGKLIGPGRKPVIEKDHLAYLRARTEIDKKSTDMRPKVIYDGNEYGFIAGFSWTISLAGDHMAYLRLPDEYTDPYKQQETQQAVAYLNIDGKDFPGTFGSNDTYVEITEKVDRSMCK